MTTPIPNCPQPETPIRERAWADGQRPEPKYSDAEVDRVAKLIADKCGNGMREKYEDVARTIVEYLLASRSAEAVRDADIRLAAFTRRVVRELRDSPKSALLQLADAIEAIDAAMQEKSHE